MWEPDYTLADRLKALTPEQRGQFFGSLEVDEIQDLASDWTLQAMDHQRMPKGAWRWWVMRCGRAAGKTYAAAHWTHEVARQGHDLLGGGEIGIIGRTEADAIKVMVEGPSGLLATAPKGFIPKWNRSDRTLVWPNGVVGRVCSAMTSLRGNHWGWVWADEVCFWRDVDKVWNEDIEFALRAGEWARGIISTTPLPHPFLREIEKNHRTKTTHSSTYANRYLSQQILSGFEEKFKGTRRERQELWGEYIDEVIGALWTHNLISDTRSDFEHSESSEAEMVAACGLQYVVVAIDPSVSNGEKSDEAGIIVAGRDGAGHAYILEDLSLKADPADWARCAVDAYRRWGANKIIAEKNQGGKLVEDVIRQFGKNLPIELIWASVGKVSRAEPVSVLYERHKVHHCGVFRELETQQCDWVPGSNNKSPDRMDALVYAVTALLLPKEQPVGPLRAYDLTLFGIPKR